MPWVISVTINDTCEWLHNGCLTFVAVKEVSVTDIHNDFTCEKGQTIVIMQIQLYIDLYLWNEYCQSLKIEIYRISGMYAIVLQQQVTHIEHLSPNVLSAAQGKVYLNTHLIVSLHRSSDNNNTNIYLFNWSKSGISVCRIQTRTTRTPAFWRYPPPPHDYPYYWPVHFESQVHTIDQFISDPKSKQGESRKIRKIREKFKF